MTGATFPHKQFEWIMQGQSDSTLSRRTGTADLTTTTHYRLQLYGWPGRSWVGRWGNQLPLITHDGNAVGPDAEIFLWMNC